MKNTQRINEKLTKIKGMFFKHKKSDNVYFNLCFYLLKISLSNGQTRKPTG
jgi:hypothetical protein